MVYRSMRIVRSWLNRARFVIPAMVMVHLFGGMLFSHFEGRSFMDGQWWATVTGFTVGYGDFYPQTVVGKLSAMVFIWTMAFLWAVVAALLVAAIMEDKNLFSHEEQEKMEAAILAVCKVKGIVPAEWTTLPPTDWWEKNHGFEESDLR